MTTATMTMTMTSSAHVYSIAPRLAASKASSERAKPRIGLAEMATTNSVVSLRDPIRRALGACVNGARFAISFVFTGPEDSDETAYDQKTLGQHASGINSRP